MNCARHFGIGFRSAVPIFSTPELSRLTRSEVLISLVAPELADDLTLAEDLRVRAVRQARSYPTVTAVIPARNEASNLPHVLPAVAELVDEIILVDGHSTDDTVALARELVPGIRIITQPGSGKGDALRAGFVAATGDVIVTIDADGSTCPSEIPAFIGTLLAGADYAKGTRFVHGAGSADLSFFRRAGNRVLVTLARILHGGRFSDLCYGYNAFWTSCLGDLRLSGDGFEIETIMNIRALRAGLDVREVASFERPRRYGESNLNAVFDGARVLRALVSELRFERSAPRVRLPSFPFHPSAEVDVLRREVVIFRVEAAARSFRR